MRQAVTRVVAGSIIVFARVQGLQELHGEVRKADAQIASDKWCNEKDEEQDQHCEIENGKTNHPSLAKLGLLERVDWRTDLSTKPKLISSHVHRNPGYLPWSQPEEDHRMELVNIGNA